MVNLSPSKSSRLEWERLTPPKGLRVVTVQVALCPFEVAVTVTGDWECFLTVTTPPSTETASGLLLDHTTGSAPFPSGARIALRVKLSPTFAV